MDDVPWWLITVMTVVVAAMVAGLIWLLDELYWVMRCAFGR